MALAEGGETPRLLSTIVLMGMGEPLYNYVNVGLKGINDSEAEARELVRLIAGMPAKVNLIPFNPWPGSTYEPSAKVALERFAEIVNAAGFAAPIRTPRGQEILAACGQLRTENRRERA
jgi:23S rRNA (adenine2503-C2)-methyltransferase